MTMKLVSIMVVCVLLVFHEEISVEAGIAKSLRKFTKRLDKCCKEIKCYPPNICEATSLIPLDCMCNKHVKIDKKRLH